MITGGSQGTVTYNYANAHDGCVVMSNFGTVTYTGLEPIINSGNATDVIFNLPAVLNAVDAGRRWPEPGNRNVAAERGDV